MHIIFQPFQQLGQNDKFIEGTGLGLAITQKLIFMLHGKLDVKSKVNQGSIFYVELPLSKVEKFDANALRPQAQIIAYEGEQRKILIVDDKLENRTVLLNLLEPLNFELSLAKNGEEAALKVQEEKPDLVLMDLVMPVMNGFEASRNIRNMKNNPPVKIIAISASVFEDDQKQSIEAGCDDFMPKPFKTEHLLAKIQQHLGLTWIYDHEQELAPLSSEGNLISILELLAKFPAQIPNQDLLTELHELAVIGDVQEILEKLTQLEQTSELYLSFVQELRKIANSFNMKKVRTFLEYFQNDHPSM